MSDPEIYERLASIEANQRLILEMMKSFESLRDLVTRHDVQVRNLESAARCQADCQHLTELRGRVAAIESEIENRRRWLAGVGVAAVSALISAVFAFARAATVHM